MRTPCAGLLAALLSFAAGQAIADITLPGPDGRQVILYDDGSWEYLTEGAPESGDVAAPDRPRRLSDGIDTATGKDVELWEVTGFVKLTVAKKYSSVTGCHFGLRVDNHLVANIRQVVPKFSAFIVDQTTGETVLYETVRRSFNNIKPTRYQYREIKFSGIRCDQIIRIRLHGTDHCSMGKLQKYSSSREECLQRIRIEPTDLVDIALWSEGDDLNTPGEGEFVDDVAPDEDIAEELPGDTEAP